MAKESPTANRCPPPDELLEMIEKIEARLAAGSTTQLRSMTPGQKEMELKAPAKVTIVIEVSDRT